MHIDEYEERRQRTRRRLRMAAIIISVMLMLAPSQAAWADAGMDVSNWQGCTSPSMAGQAYNSGSRFAILKASEGLSRDWTFSCSMSGLSHTPLRLGAYHFARPERNNPVAEADGYVSVIRPYLGSGSLLLALDWEPPAAWRGRSDWALAWLDRVERLTGVKPLIYMSASVIHAGDWSRVAGQNYGLWVAGYPRGYQGERLRNPGSVPYSVSPWPFAAAWQYSSTGLVGGYTRPIDIDWFYGDAVTWAKYANPGGVKANPTQVAHIAAQQPQTRLREPSKPFMTTVQLAQAVIRGDYGNGQTRVKLLGARYGEVMAEVNRLLRPRPFQPAPGGLAVIVRRGDTLSRIASRYNRWPLSAWHVPSGDRNLIYPGQTVTYQPGRAYGGGASVTGWHVVRRGETLSGIYGRSWPWHAHVNGLRWPYIIYPGQRLR